MIAVLILAFSIFILIGLIGVIYKLDYIINETIKAMKQIQKKRKKDG